VSKNKKILAWESVDWQSATNRVLSLQRRIYKAQTNGSKYRVHGLQKLLINSLDAKLLAVQWVTTLNKFHQNLYMVDRQIITTPSEKMTMAQNLSLNGKSCSIKKVKPGKVAVAIEKRRIFYLGIPTIQDRAKQALAKYALEPEWEAVFEPNSYGFRPGRSAHDAIEAVFITLRHNRPKWVFDADIKKYFDRIDHSYLLSKLNTFPQMEEQVRAWLKAGITEEYANIPKTEPSFIGTPQGGIISPLLLNIALHGLEHHLKEYVGGIALTSNKVTSPSNAAFGDVTLLEGDVNKAMSGQCIAPLGAIDCLPKRRQGLSFKSSPTAHRGNHINHINHIKDARAESLTIVRYADDFVVIHPQREILDLCVDETRSWLSKVGLELSEKKYSVKDCRESFTFLGFTITLIQKQKRYKVKIVPSRESRRRYLDNVRNIIKSHRSASTYELISMLRPVVISWANYFRFCECMDIFSTQTHLLFQMLRHWAFRRHPNEARSVVKEKYWPSGRTYYYDETKHQDDWVFCGKTLKKGLVVENHLPQMTWICSRKFVKIQGVKSPFDSDHAYWALINSK